MTRTAEIFHLLVGIGGGDHHFGGGDLDAQVAGGVQLGLDLRDKAVRKSATSAVVDDLWGRHEEDRLEAIFFENVGQGLLNQVLDGIAAEPLAIQALYLTGRHFAGSEAAQLDLLAQPIESATVLLVEAGGLDSHIDLTLQRSCFGDFYCHVSLDNGAM
jgi:hypothetical protein